MVAVPFATFGKFEPVTMWYMTRYASVHCVTFIDTDEGITGVATQGDQHVIINKFRPKLIGKDPFDIEKIESELPGEPGVPGRWSYIDSVAAIDNALWDIVGKVCGMPLYKLWGGKVNDPIHVRYWMCTKSPEEMAAEAVKAVKRGWKAFKVKLGTDPETDMERIRAIREAVGYKVQLCVDFNGAYTLNVVKKLIKKMDSKYDLAFVETPVPCVWPYDPGSLDAMADIRKVTEVPIEAHSHGPNCEEFVLALINKRAADALHLNVSWVGSILECRRLCAIAEAGGLIVTGQSSCAELGPRNAFLLHLITSERAFKGYHDSSTHHLEPPSGDIIREEFRTVNGTLRVPEGPGLGLEIDEKKLQHYHDVYKSGKYNEVGPGLGRRNWC